MGSVQLNQGREFVSVMLSALSDSDQTEDLLIGEEISSVGRMRALLPSLRATEEGRAILSERPVLSTGTVDFEALRGLPPYTLGRSYVDHLERHGLDPDALTTPVTRSSDALSCYLLERVRQTHDIWHTMLGLGAQGHEEVLVHAFQWPQLRMPYSALVVVFGTLKHVVGEARWRVLSRDLGRAVRAGQAARPLLPVYWERHWGEPLDEMRARLRVAPLAL